MTLRPMATVAIAVHADEGPLAGVAARFGAELVPPAAIGGDAIDDRPVVVHPQVHGTYMYAGDPLFLRALISVVVVLFFLNTESHRSSKFKFSTCTSTM